MENINKANKGVKAIETVNTPIIETAIDKNDWKAFIASKTNSDGTVRPFVINDITDWFSVDGKRVRDYIRKQLKLNAPVHANGSIGYVFKANDPSLKAIFDRFANGTGANGTRRSNRVGYDEQGFLVRIENI